MAVLPTPETWLLELRDRLRVPPPRRLVGSEARPAAVLVPLFVRAGELWTLLVRRSARVAHHRLQWAFPGGGIELGEDPWGAALREGQEEIGLPRSSVLRLGELDEQSTPSGFRIVPCVGAIPGSFSPRPDGGEIEEALSVRLQELSASEASGEKPILVNGQPRTLRLYRAGNQVVWGVTARVLENLLERMR